jgi:hypothetical protein
LKATVNGLPVNTPWDYALGANFVGADRLAAGSCPRCAGAAQPVDALRAE